MNGMTLLLVGAIIGLIGAQMLSSRAPQVTYMYTERDDSDARSGSGCLVPIIGTIFVVVVLALLTGGS